MKRLRIVVAAGTVSEDLVDFPVIVRLPASMVGRRISFSDLQGNALPSMPTDRSGERIWVRLTKVSATDDTVFYGDDRRNNTARPSVQNIFSSGYSFIASKSSTGSADIQMDHGVGNRNAMAVEAWIHVEESRAEKMQVIVSQWPLSSSLDSFSTYDAGSTDGLETTGFFGAMCDGRYIYFSPQCNTTGRHGNALRYDTHGDFHDSASWSGYDGGNTSGLETQGYYGVIATGRYVFYVPRHNRLGQLHSAILRYDSKNGDFGDALAWSAYDLGLKCSSQGCAFDGRYIYFVPGYADSGNNGLVIRYDTTAPFDVRESYTTYDASDTNGLACYCYDGAVFDGRHIYFVPLTECGNMLRYDTRKPFGEASSWRARNIIEATDPRISMCVGAVFDGRYVYYVPYGDNTSVVRYDTEVSFDADASWESRDVADTSGLECRGFDGANFDGRYIYFVPFFSGSPDDSGFHCHVLWYDTSKDFHNDGAWSAADGSRMAPPNPGGFNGGAFDGRFLYFAPWRKDQEPGDPTGDGSIFPHGQVLRYDTAAADARFVLKYMDCGHNGGLGASIPGPVFTVNTENGPVSVRSNYNPGQGWHHLAGVYDGQKSRLYIDGSLVGIESGNGRLVDSYADVLVGEFEEGCSPLVGNVNYVSVANCVRSDAWIKASASNAKSPDEFVAVTED